MALFVLGAGATRGASFVDPRKDPCLPPLDGDFFTQLQRVRNSKHRDLVTSVMRDVVELFGSNFDVTMETVFTTLEQTRLMLNTTGESRDFKINDMKEQRDRLVQAVACVLEDSLAQRSTGRGSKFEPKNCEHHAALIKRVALPGDDFVSFNYDCVLDYALKENGEGKWNPRFGYGFRFGKGRTLKDTEYWEPPGKAVSRANTIHLYKLHGSLHFVAEGPEDSPRSIRLKQRPYARNYKRQRFSIIPPESHKAYNKGAFRNLWQSAAAALHRADHVVIIGYSLPLTDAHATALFRTSMKKQRLKSVIVVNPDRQARRRIRSVLQRGLSHETRVLSFDYLPEFLALERTEWDQTAPSGGLSSTPVPSPGSGGASPPAP